MKRISYIICTIKTFLFFLPAFAQVSFRTVVPRHVMVPGESFQVQYILENAKKATEFTPPQFTGLRVVSGPNTYSGDQSPSHRNIVFTLAAVKEGIFKIPGASCLIDGRIQKSNAVTIRVLSPKESDQSSYYLRPGEDPYKKIRENLFLKLVVNKQTCFMGEPLVATFKLYSRLQSRSNVIKNPGFYGFSVYDMIDVNDKIESEEKMNGNWFDVHTIREVQLYPLQAGTFTIDAMELANQIEFYHSAVNKQTEQEVTENMYGKSEKKDIPDPNGDVYEMNIRSNRAVITVKPLPGSTLPDTFAGAVGRFSIAASVVKDSLLKNEEGVLVVNINGAGNFQRVNAPLIHWPSNLEVFEPSVKDSLDKQQIPLKGERNFKYFFVSDKPGYYTIPSIAFSFFDLTSKSYKTVSSSPISIFISSKNKKTRLAAVPVIVVKAHDKWFIWLLAAGLGVLIVILYLLLRNRKKISSSAQHEIEEPAKTYVPLEEILMPASAMIASNDKSFCEELKQTIWNFFYNRLTPGALPTNKIELANVLRNKGIRQSLVDQLMEIIRQCETGLYTNAEINVDKTRLFRDARNTLDGIEESLFKS